jgi:hypothetical protein
LVVKKRLNNLGLLTEILFPNVKTEAADITIHIADVYVLLLPCWHPVHGVIAKAVLCITVTLFFTCIYNKAIIFKPTIDIAESTIL